MHTRWGLLAGAAAVFGSVLAAPAPLHAAPPETRRIGGVDRYETAALVSAEAFPPGVEQVVVTSGASVIDGVSAAPAAAKAKAPILYSKLDEVPAPTVNELRRLRPKNITIVGGLEAVSDKAADELVAAGTPQGGAAPKLARIAGVDRYETSAAVAAVFQADGLQRAYVAPGDRLDLAVIAGPPAALTGGPVLLSPRDALPQSIIAQLDRLNPPGIEIIGDTNALSANVEQQLQPLSGVVRRLDGTQQPPDSFSLLSSRFVRDPSLAYIVTDNSFPDPAAVGTLAAQAGRAVIFVHEGGACVTEDVWQYFDARPDLGSIVIGGSEAVVADPRGLPSCSPPRLFLTSSTGTTVEPRLDASCWGPPGRALCADGFSDEGPRLEVTRGTEVSFRFTSAVRPISLHGEIYPPGKPEIAHTFDAAGNTTKLTLDGPPGLYVLRITTTWSRGDTTHVLHVNLT
jgi:putative cell wall-binding protein